MATSGYTVISPQKSVVCDLSSPARRPEKKNGATVQYQSAETARHRILAAADCAAAPRRSGDGGSRMIHKYLMVAPLRTYWFREVRWISCTLQW